MGIPYARDYISTVSGSIFKLVRCEECGTEYVYEMHRQASGSERSWLFLDNEGAAESARANAHEELRWRLECDVDLVPCPVCGRYQQDMLPKARLLHRRWMYKLGVCFTIALVPLSLIGALINAGGERMPPRPPHIPWSIFLFYVLALALLGMSLVVARSISAARYDPNAEDVNVRKQLGQSWAMLRSEFEEMKAEEDQIACEPPPIETGGDVNENVDS